MNDFVKDKEYFSRLVEALEPWTDRVVFVGGWASRLYRYHPFAERLEYEALATQDADVAVPEDLEANEETIAHRLEERNFRPDMVGEVKPPVIYYRLSGEGNFFAEFLSPLRGGRTNRDGTPNATTMIAGVSAQKLRYIELLLNAPWTVALKNEDGFTVTDGIEIRVPNPIGFLVQKVLIHSEREFEDRAKDILYMHDTFEVFGEQLFHLSAIWHNDVSPILSAKAGESIEKIAESLFGGVSDAMRQAALIDPTRALRPEMIQELCQYAWSQVLAKPAGN